MRIQGTYCISMVCFPILNKNCWISIRKAMRVTGTESCSGRIWAPFPGQTLLHSRGPLSTCEEVLCSGGRLAWLAVRENTGLWDDLTVTITTYDNYPSVDQRAFRIWSPKPCGCSLLRVKIETKCSTTNIGFNFNFLTIILNLPNPWNISWTS